VDTSQILSIFIKGALGSRGRKRARKASRFLGGNRGFLSASALMGAAGVAWGIYETMQQKSSESTAAAPASYPPSPAMMPPPIPGAAPAAAAADDAAMPREVLRIVRLAVSAARADGVLLPAERALILSHARAAGLESVVETELAAPRPLSEIVGGVADDTSRRDLYILAFTIVRADEHVSGAERVYLAQLAHQLGLDAATTAQLEAETASQIDATPDTNP
jgi:uncharacterized membrane protein YebE (DUF533 family)